jgi:hypothetical protein
MSTSRSLAIRRRQLIELMNLDKISPSVMQTAPHIVSQTSQTRQPLIQLLSVILLSYQFAPSTPLLAILVRYSLPCLPCPAPSPQPFPNNSLGNRSPHPHRRSGESLWIFHIFGVVESLWILQLCMVMHRLSAGHLFVCSYES